MPEATSGWRAAWSRLSLRGLLLLLVSATAVPLIGLLAYQIARDAKSKVETSRQLIQSLARATASDTSAALLEIEHALGKLAERPLIRALDPAQCDSVLGELRAFLPNVANVSTIDHRGNMVCSATRQSGSTPLNVSANEWFPRIRQTSSLVLGSPMLGAVTRSWITPMALPLHGADGRFAGAVAIAINLAAFAPIQRANLPPGVVVGIVDSKGVIVARSERAEELIGRDVSGTTIGRAMMAGVAKTEILVGNDGTERYFAYQPVAQSGWSVTVGVPTSQVYADVSRSVILNSLGALCILGLAAAMAITLLHRVSAPLIDLRGTVRAVAAGQLDRRAADFGTPEQQELAVAFNQMLDRLPAIERALRESEERYRSLFTATPIAARVTLEGRVVMANPAALALLGDCIGKDPIESLHPDYRDKGRMLLNQALHDRRIAYNEDALILNAAGNPSAVSIVIVPFEYQGQPAVLTMISDISTQKQLAREVEARRAELARLAQLLVAKQTASAIAHELNQPLVAVAAYSETALAMLRQGADNPARLAQALEGAVAQALRAGETLHTLMNFLQKGETEPESLDLNSELAASVADETRFKLHQIDMVLDPDPGLPPVLGNRVQLQMVLATLLQNAADAMDAADTPGKTRRVTITTQRDGGMARVSVHDTGSGIAPALVARLFEPFFTSKPAGIGLGLNISRALVESLGGRLWHDTDCRDGTLFHFTVPLAP